MSGHRGSVYSEHSDRHELGGLYTAPLGILVPEAGESKIKALAAPRSGEARSLVMRQRLCSHLVEGPAL